MPRITMELLRKRSEHNEGEISTLEEISLHQENIEKIELLNQACRDLKILLLQHNLISKIENLNKLKRLEYLNLTLNNIQVIENLEGLESLKKLDLTMNFIGDLQGVKKLRCNEFLENLILTGNPCVDYEGYREFVVSSLPQLKQLDNTEIDRTERIKSLQIFAEATGNVIRSFKNYSKFRAKQIRQYENRETMKITEIGSDEDEEENSKFWKSMSSNTPEDRIAIAERRMRSEIKKKNPKKEVKVIENHVTKFFSPEGRAYNVNQAKVSFKLNDDDDPENIILNVSLYKHLDPSYVDVDVQPSYVKVTIKGKVLQLKLPCEVRTEKSHAKRNVTTGSLTITMPRLKPSPVKKPQVAHAETVPSELHAPATRPGAQTKRELLEIGPSRNNLEFLQLFEGENQPRPRKPKTNTDFCDDPEVPPLE